MSTVCIDVEDYLSDDDVRKIARRRGILRDFAEGAAPGERPETNVERWQDLADEIRAASRAGDRTHLDILLLRMLRYADIGQPHPLDLTPTALARRYRA